MLKDEVGNCFTDQKDIESIIVGYYKDLFNSNNSSFPDQIVSLQLFECCEVPNMCELKEAVFSIGGVKAPGEDGFHAIFFQHFWETLKNGSFLLYCYLLNFTLPNSNFHQRYSICLISS